MDAWKPKKTAFDVLKEIAQCIAIMLMFMAMFIMMAALA